jgi:hypothetical protein
MVWGPLHGVVDQPGWWLWRRLSGFLVHSPFGVKVNGAVFGAMVGFVVVVHVV